jgi:iron complex transport system ATP-binding protein
LSAFLSAREVSYLWRGRPLVDAVSLELEVGKTTVLVGPNGVGKSTLLRLLSGELRPTSGSVSYAEESLGRTPPWLLACRRAVMTQSVQVSFDFAVHEIVRLGMDGIGHIAASRRADTIEKCLAIADVQNLATRRYEALSGGEQRRVQFARVLAQIEAGRSIAGRQALLLDEPTANLDLRHQLALLDAVRTVAREGVAVFAILHDLNLAVRCADKIALMSHGAIVASGPPSVALRSSLLSEVFGLDLSVAAAFVAVEPLVLPSRWQR